MLCPCWRLMAGSLDAFFFVQLETVESERSDENNLQAYLELHLKGMIKQICPNGPHKVHATSTCWPSLCPTRQVASEKLLTWCFKPSTQSAEKQSRRFVACKGLTCLQQVSFGQTHAFTYLLFLSRLSFAPLRPTLIRFLKTKFSRLSISKILLSSWNYFKVQEEETKNELNVPGSHKFIMKKERSTDSNLH